MSALDEITAKLDAAYDELDTAVEQLIAYAKSVPAADDGNAADPVAPDTAAGVATDAAAAGTVTPVAPADAPAESGSQHGGTGETETVAPAEQPPVEGLNPAQHGVVPPPVAEAETDAEEAAEEAAEQVSESSSSSSSSTPSPAPAEPPPTVSTSPPPDTAGL